MDSVRTVLEVLKFVAPLDVLQRTSVTSRHWHKCTESPELWWTFCEGEGVDPDPSESSDPKTLYRDNLRQIAKLLLIRGAEIRVISVKDFSVSHYSLPASTGVTDDNGYCFISPNKVMCFGAAATPNVCEINLRTMTVTPLSPMQKSRVYPGLLRYEKYIYVFGGRICVCEKYNLRTASWIRIEDSLHDPLEALVPAQHKDKVYLAGHTTVEVFHILTESFTILNFPLPIDWWYILACIHGNDLVVLQQGIVSRWTLDSNENSFRRTEMTSMGSGYWSNCIPVWWGGKLYSLHNDIPNVLGMFEFDPTKSELTQVMTVDEMQRPKS